jgi:hypothetical protein
MAYVGKDEQFPIWLPESLPEEIVAESFFELLNVEQNNEGSSHHQEEPNFGFIIQDWFGPFLLSPPTRFLRGQC